MLKQFLKRTAAVAMSAALAMSMFVVSAYAKPKSLSKNVNVGDMVYFGKYEQDNNKKNGKEKIEWRVLDKKDGKALLISRDVLDIRSYNKNFKEITWEKCTLRKWLNKDFLRIGFSSKEQKKIQTAKVVNDDNEEYGTKGGKNTNDKIFLLSKAEADKYFKDDGDRVSMPSSYTIARLSKLDSYFNEQYFDENGRAWYWWLRSPGPYQTFAAVVEYGGQVNDSNSEADGVDGDYYGVRPAMWVRL